MDLTAIVKRIDKAELRGCAYMEADLAEVESQLRGAIPQWYRDIVLSHPITNLRYKIESEDPDFYLDLIIPHPVEMRDLAAGNYLFADHSSPIFDLFRNAWFPFGVDSTGSGSPMWVVSARNTDDHTVYQFHGDMWGDVTAPPNVDNGMRSTNLTFESILSMATIIEHVTSDPFAPKAPDLRFEPSCPPLDALITSSPEAGNAEQGGADQMPTQGGSKSE